MQIYRAQKNVLRTTFLKRFQILSNIFRMFSLAILLTLFAIYFFSNFNKNRQNKKDLLNHL